MPNKMSWMLLAKRPAGIFRVGGQGSPQHINKKTVGAVSPIHDGFISYDYNFSQ